MAEGPCAGWGHVSDFGGGGGKGRGAGGVVKASVAWMSWRCCQGSQVTVAWSRKGQGNGNGKRPNFILTARITSCWVQITALSVPLCQTPARLPSLTCPALPHAELCFKCGRPGHMVRNCPTLTASSWELGYGHCIRCASASCPCANKADYFRWGVLRGS